LATSEKELEFRLPEGTQIDGLDVAINGQRSFPALDSANLIVKLPLPQKKEAGDFVVEITYLNPPGGYSLGNMPLEFPQALSGGTTAFFRWQLKTNSDVHLLAGPTNLTPELSWHFRPLLCDRQSSMTQYELEQWVGASLQPAIADAETNQYLFSAFGH